jgi:hypothetical protein
MKRIIATTIVLVVSVLFAAAQPAKEPYAPGLGEFMTATQLRHAKTSLPMRLTRSRKAWRTPKSSFRPMTAFLSPR